MTEEQKRIKEIAEQLEYMIKRRVDAHISEKFELSGNVIGFVETINDMLATTVSNQEAFDKGNLTWNHVESEGYRRALLGVKELIKNYNLEITDAD